MPADRSRSRRTDQPSGDCAQLVWTVPVDPFSISQPAPTEGSGISFTSAMTPCNFHEYLPKPSAQRAKKEVDIGTVMEPSSVIFQVDSQQVTPRQVTAVHSRKKPPNHIPRPPNAFILFRSSFIRSQKISTEVETNHSTLSKIIGLTWQNLPDEEKEVWHAQARAKLDEHKKRFPGYAFRPVHSKRGADALEPPTADAPTPGAMDPFVVEQPTVAGPSAARPTKRRVREIEPKDEKRCARIAQLLGQGMKGTELEKRMEEFDRSHPKEVKTRFEEPMTAREFRPQVALEEVEPSSQPESPSLVKRTSMTKESRRQSSSSRKLRPTASAPSILTEVPDSPVDRKPRPSRSHSYPEISHIRTDNLGSSHSLDTPSESPLGMTFDDFAQFDFNSFLMGEPCTPSSPVVHNDMPALIDPSQLGMFASNFGAADDSCFGSTDCWSDNTWSADPLAPSPMAEFCQQLQHDVFAPCTPYQPQHDWEYHPSQSFLYPSSFATYPSAAECGVLTG